MRVGLCDSNETHINLFKDELIELGKKNDVVLNIKTFISGEQLLFEMEDLKEPLDFIYLDVLMQGKDGVKVAHELRKMGYQGEIIFHTFSRDHMLDGYDVDALHYVVKQQTSKEKREKIFKKAVSRSKNRKKEVLTVSCAGESRTVALEDIYYFKVDRQVITVYYKNESFEFYTSLGKIENSLFGKGFIRIHRNCLVSESKIKSMVYGQITLINGTSLQVGKTYNKNTKEELEKKRII